MSNSVITRPAPEPGLLGQLLLAWVPFSFGVAAIVLASLAEPSVQHARATFSIWLSLLLAAPALALYIRDAGIRPLGRQWRLFWTVSFIAYALHFWYGFGVMFGGDMAAVMASQGIGTALFNYAVSVLWAIDVGLAWLSARGRLVGIVRLLTHAGVLAAGLTATILFREGIARAIGVVVLAVVLAAVIWRFRSSKSG